MRSTILLLFALALLSLASAHMICRFGPCAPMTKCRFGPPCPTYAATVSHGFTSECCPRGPPASPPIASASPTSPATLTTPTQEPATPLAALVRREEQEPQTTLATHTRPHWEPIKPFQWHGPVRAPRTAAAVTAPTRAPLHWEPIRPFQWHGPVRVSRVPVVTTKPTLARRVVSTRGAGMPVPGMPSQGELSWGYGAGETVVTRGRGGGGR
ncbi:hypothetical protein MMC18_006702 [Xylographa bjoerkii]|nr:hypothetical protein [Xylographa bjoerkii]